MTKTTAYSLQAFPSSLLPRAWSRALIHFPFPSNTCHAGYYPKIRLTNSVRPFFKADFDQRNKTKSITDKESIKVQEGMFKKGIQYSLEFWIPRRGFQIPGTGYQSLSVELWTLDSNGYWDSWFLELYSVFQSPGFLIPQARISDIPESGFPYTRQSRQFTFTFTSHGVYIPFDFTQFSI